MRLFLRILLTLLLVGWLFTLVDFTGVAGVVAGAKVEWLLLATLVNLSTMLLAAWRWDVLLAGLDVRHPFRDLLRISFVSTFFSLFLPSSVSGDVMKMIMLVPDNRRREMAVSSVLLDRVLSMAVSNLIGLVAILCTPSVWGDRALITTMIVVSAGFWGGVVVLFSPALLSLVRRLTPATLWGKIGPAVERVRGSLVDVRERPRTLLVAAGIATVRQLVVCLSIYLVGLGVGITVSPVAYFAVVPIALAITALPIAINGLGLQDNALVVLLGAMGVASAQALTLSLFIHALRYITGLIGGILFVVGRPSAETRIAPAAATTQPEG